MTKKELDIIDANKFVFVELFCPNFAKIKLAKYKLLHINKRQNIKGWADDCIWGMVKVWG